MSNQWLKAADDLIVFVGGPPFERQRKTEYLTTSSYKSSGRRSKRWPGGNMLDWGSLIVGSLPELRVLPFFKTPQPNGEKEKMVEVDVAQNQSTLGKLGTDCLRSSSA
jgi:hypothetical protein